MDGRLAGAIDQLYRAFERYPLVRIEICSCGCVSPEYRELLRSKPLRQLGSDDLANYAFRALGTMGGIDAWKHYLPRIFELCAIEDEIQAEVAVGKLAEAKWRDWPLREQEAVEGFLNAWWLAQLDRSADEFDPEEVLSAASRAGVDLGWFLEQWAPLRSHLALFLVRHETELRRRGNVGFLFSPQAGSRVLAWLKQLPTGFLDGTGAEPLLNWICSSRLPLG